MWGYDTFKGYLIDFLQWIIDFIFDLIDNMLKPIIELIPDLGISDKWAAVVVYLSWADKWFPVALATSLLFAFISIFLAVNFVNWILGLIPGEN